jgi:lysine 2,3-aminomutase
VKKVKNSKNKEIISVYLKDHIKFLEKKYGNNSEEVMSIKNQYCFNEKELNVKIEESNKHYEADASVYFKNVPLHNIERLYKRTLVIEITSICATRCRWCLRANYKPIIMKEKELDLIAEYCGTGENKNNLREVLITGGDPLMVPDKLNFLIKAIINKAPNIKIIRIGSRVPLQDPKRINSRLLDILQPSKNIKFELGTQINSYLELSEQSRYAFKNLVSNGIKIYCQNVLLKNINDDINFLIKLYDECRYLGIESHYLFHCVPIKGMYHHRTSVTKGLELIRKLTSGGYFSGRSKPLFSLMTDLGKITLYEGTILERKKNYLLLQSEYFYEERKKWNKNWKIPDSAIVDKSGKMSVWYLDGCDD